MMKKKVIKLTFLSSLFLNHVFEFLGMGLALYGLAILYESLSHDPIIKHTVKCRYCKKPVNVRVCSSPSPVFSL